MSAGKPPWWQITRTARQGVGLGILWVGLGLGRLPDARDNILDLVASVLLLALGGFYLANAIALRRERQGLELRFPLYRAGAGICWPRSRRLLLLVRLLTN
jgi:hypothetical protein